MASLNQEEAAEYEMDVQRPHEIDAEGMDDLEQEEDVEGDDDEGYEDGVSLSAQMHQFLTEMDLDLAQRRQALKSLSKGGGGRHARGGGGALPQHLKAAMGQANLRVARGDLEEAIKICMEVVRQAPDVPEPFATLEMVYEEMGDEDKRFQFALIAAHLQPRDSQQWIKTAELAEQRGDLRVAVKCYTKAITITPSNVALLWKKASLLHTLTHATKALETYQKLLSVLPASSGQDYVAVSMEMAKIHHDAQNTVQAIEVLKSAYHRHFASVTEEAVNMLAELYVVTKDYWGALETILEYYSIPLPKELVESGREGDLPSLETFIAPIPAPDSPTPPSTGAAVSTPLSEAIGRSLNLMQSPPTEVTQLQFDGEKEEDPIIKFVEELVIPTEVPLDLKTKVAVCLIHLYATAPQHLLFSLYELDAEDYGDVFLDIAEAFMDSELYARAQPLLSILVETQNYSQAGVWLKHAECLHSLNQLESAATSYAEVVALAPHHTYAKLTLATIYGQLGWVDDALAVLGGEGAVGDGWPEEAPLAHFPLMTNADQLSASIQDLRVSFRRFDLLFYEERLPECSELALEMLHFLFRDYIYHPNLKAMAHLSFKSVKRKVTEVEYKSEELKKELQAKEKQLSWEEWWNVMDKGCQALWMLGRKDDLCRVVFAANVSNWFGGITKEMDYELAALSFSACALSGDWKQAVLFLRTLISSDWPQSGSHSLHALWNYFNLGPQNLSIVKFLLRLLIKDQGSLPVLKMGANYYFCSGSFRTSLNLYHAVLKRDPTDHLTYFCMGLVFLTMAHQKGKVIHLPRSPLIAQAFAFLCRYAKLRGRCQETLYNLGRAFHQIGFVNYASHLYKLVLTVPPELADDPSSDLKQEAAYNLALIYKNSQNKALARHVLWTYIRV